MEKLSEKMTDGKRDASSLVSVIVPVYNNSKFLNKCLLSIVNQSYSNLEIIVVDDGSEDKSRDICEKFSKNDQRIQLVYSCHIGVSSARNEGIKKINGKYCCFVDSDDWLPRTAIEKLLFRLEKENADFCYGDYILVDALNMKKIWTQFGNSCCILEQSSEFTNFLRQMHLGPCWKLFKSEIIKKHSIKFPEDVSFGEDEQFNLRYFYFCNKIAVESSSVYFYNRLNKFSATRRCHLDYNRWTFETAMEYEELFGDSKKKDEVKTFIAEKFFLKCFQACQHYILFEKENGEKITNEKIIETFDVFQMHLHRPIVIEENSLREIYEIINRFLTTKNILEFKKGLREMEHSYSLPKWKKIVLEILRQLKLLYYFSINIRSYLN